MPQCQYAGSRRSCPGRGGFFVTTFIAGAGRSMRNRKIPARIVRRHAAALFTLLAASIGLAGCESSSGVFGTTGSTQPETQLVQSAAYKPATTRISVAPVIGAPDGIAKQLAQDFSAAISQKNITVVSAQDKSDYAVRGYIVAAKDKAATKVSYIWDVTDPAGKRVNRITGEEVVASAAADAWSVVTPQTTQAIAQKSAGSLTAWSSIASQRRSNLRQSGMMAATRTTSANVLNQFLI